jgi:hypothetical protein
MSFKMNSSYNHAGKKRGYSSGGDYVSCFNADICFKPPCPMRISVSEFYNKTHVHIVHGRRGTKYASMEQRDMLNLLNNKENLIQMMHQCNQKCREVKLAEELKLSGLTGDAGGEGGHLQNFITVDPVDAETVFASPVTKKGKKSTPKKSVAVKKQSPSKEQSAEGNAVIIINPEKEVFEVAEDYVEDDEEEELGEDEEEEEEDKVGSPENKKKKLFKKIPVGQLNN